MFAKLKGFVDSIFEDYIILDVNDVGYQVFCSTKTISKIQDCKDKITLNIETIVKEDSITLFGFYDLQEKNTFNTLCKVNGVGNKMAIKITSVLTTDEIIYAIVNKDKDFFTQVPSIGPKLASRIISELQGCQLVKNAELGNINITSSKDNKIDENVAKDAIIALENLGYQKSMVKNIVKSLLEERPDLTLESIITNALKKINNL